MGTRSLTIFKDEKGEEIAVMYIHYDGYLHGYGKKLAEFLQDIEITNGIPFPVPDKKFANGMNCLAAQVVAHFKTGVGNVYLYPAGKCNIGEDYIYEVSPEGKEVHIIAIKLHGDNSGILVLGKASEVLSKIISRDKI
jgi:hypothetical protein